MKDWMRSVMQTRAKKIGAFGAIAALVIAGLTVVTMQPASAGCTREYWYHNNKAVIDNCPGNGASSWAWVWDGESDIYGVYLDVQFYDGSYASVGKPNPPANNCGPTACADHKGLAVSTSFSWGGGIWRARMCRYDANAFGWGINRGCAAYS